MNTNRHWTNSGENRLILTASTLEFDTMVAAEIVGALNRTLACKPTAVLVPSAGRSPSGAYQILQTHYSDNVDWARVAVVQMDEYLGIPCNHPRSMANFIQTRLVDPLGFKTFLHFLDSQGNPSCPLEEYDRNLETLGGIDVVVHGIGRNGHIAFNEPGTEWDAPTRQVTLAPETLLANLETAELRRRYPEGLTLGMQQLTSAGQAILLIAGAGKEGACQKLLTQPPNLHLPASSLCKNESVVTIISARMVDQTGERQDTILDSECDDGPEPARPEAVHPSNPLKSKAAGAPSGPA